MFTCTIGQSESHIHHIVEQWGRALFRSSIIAIIFHCLHGKLKSSPFSCLQSSACFTCYTSGSSSASNLTWLSKACVQPCKFQSASHSRVPKFDFISLRTEQVAAERSSLCHPPHHYCSNNCSRCSWQAEASRLMFNVSAPQIDARLSETCKDGWDCWMVPLVSRHPCWTAAIGEGRLYRSVNWL